MKDTIIGITFLVWFIGSLVGMFLAGESQNALEWILILFGQYFLVFGLIGVNAKKEESPKQFPYIILVFPLVGAACVVAGVYMLIGGKIARENMNNIAPFLFLALFILVGIFMVYNSLSKMLYLKRVCTYEVNAQCVEISTSWSSSKHGGYNELHMPIYSFWYNSEEHRVKNDIYTSKNFIVGEYYKLMVNPNNVQEFIDKNSKSFDGVMFFMGIVFIAMPLFATAVVLGLIPGL